MVGDRQLNAQEAARLCGVTPSTLRRWAWEGRLPTHYYPGTKRRLYFLSDIQPWVVQPDTAGPGSQLVAYARVSSRRQTQEGDLERQQQRLREWAEHDRPGQELLEYSDIASGLADNRRGWWAAIKACQRPTVTELIATHPDRIARFGVVTTQHMLAGYGVQVKYIESDPLLDSSAESELVRDMLAIVTSFSGRLYGQRSAKAARIKKACATAVKQDD